MAGFKDPLFSFFSLRLPIQVGRFLPGALAARPGPGVFWDKTSAPEQCPPRVRMTHDRPIRTARVQETDEMPL